MYAQCSAESHESVFQKSDLMNKSRKLIHEGVVGWKSARGKTTDVMAVLLSDLIFFMQESNQKYAFYTQDNKVPTCHKATDQGPVSQRFVKATNSLDL